MTICYFLPVWYYPLRDWRVPLTTLLPLTLIVEPLPDEAGYLALIRIGDDFQTFDTKEMTGPTATELFYLALPFWLSVSKRYTRLLQDGGDDFAVRRDIHE